MLVKKSVEANRKFTGANAWNPFLCGATGIVNDTIEQSAAYLQGWLKALRNDPRMLVLAAAQAQKAADSLRNVRHAEA